MQERWSEAAPPVSHLRAPAQEAVVGARDRADDLLTAPGSLGVLDTVLDRLGALALPNGPGTLVIAAADHAVTDHGVSAFDPAVTADLAQATREGTSRGAVAARAAGMDLDLVDAGIGVRRGDLVGSDALDEQAYAALLALGRERGRAAAGSGLVALGEIGIGNTTVAAALAAALLGLPAGRVVGRGSSADAAMIERKVAVVERALARVAASPERAVSPGHTSPAGRGNPAPPATPEYLDPEGAVRRLGGGEFAVLTGVVLGAVEAGAGVVLDGLATSVCALAAVRLEPAVAAHLVAGHRSRERAHAAVLEELGLEPLLDLRIRTGEGAGAALAVGLIRDGLELRRSVARTTTR
jgi:nicotinate-nucleotide--dimethylbenzimidazole phosphoribosyltransferase